MKTVENLCILKRASLTAGQPVPAMHLRTENGVTSIYEAGAGHVVAVLSQMIQLLRSCSTVRRRRRTSGRSCGSSVRLLRR